MKRRGLTILGCCPGVIAILVAALLLLLLV
jgi:hypothetical protein